MGVFFFTTYIIHTIYANERESPTTAGFERFERGWGVVGLEVA